jgi:hypothetical protein
MVQDRKYESQPFIHPDVTNAVSPFRVFHQEAGLLYFATTSGGRTRIPKNEFTNLNVAAGTFSVPDWTAFCKKYGVFTVTVSGGGKPVPAHNNWWAFQPNKETGSLVITDPTAARTALGVSASTTITPAASSNGAFQVMPLMPSANIPAGTRSHEYTHAIHSHRANFHKMVRALDPRRVLESSVSTPSNPVNFGDQINVLSTEILKPNHEIVDEVASKAAGKFVAGAGQKMAAINQDPGSGASLGALWDITHDTHMG